MLMKQRNKLETLCGQSMLEVVSLATQLPLLKNQDLARPVKVQLWTKKIKINGNTRPERTTGGT